MKRASTPDGLLLLSNSPPDTAQKRLAAAIVAVFVTLLLLVAPFSQYRLKGSEALVPAYAAALLLVELITATLLINLYAVQRDRAVLLLAIAYLFSGLLVVPWALTFPDVFAVFGLDQGLQSTASIAAVRRIGFPTLVLAYILLNERPDRGDRWSASARVPIMLAFAGCVAAVAGLSVWILANDGLLPRLMLDASRITGDWRLVAWISVLLYAAGLGLLAIRGRSILDLWLMVVLCTLLIEIVLMSFISAGIRLSVGWWSGRLYGLASASIVLLVLLVETTRLYERLGRSLLSERRAREARLTALEALSASIAHEVNQPLASMVTNADAGLYWLDRDAPELAETRSALSRIVSDGHRAGEVVRSIRDLFKNGVSDRTGLDPNHLIRDVAMHSEAEAAAVRARLELRLEPGLPSVAGDPIQLQSVVANLIRNALDALAGQEDYPRSIVIASALSGEGDIVVSVADTGPGVATDARTRIFEPFYTTKTDGMGMGLMFCRSIIENHGGRLWESDNSPRGAVFSFTLPAEPPRDPIGVPAA